MTRKELIYIYRRVVKGFLSDLFYCYKKPSQAKLIAYNKLEQYAKEKRRKLWCILCELSRIFVLCINTV